MAWPLPSELLSHRDLVAESSIEGRQAELRQCEASHVLFCCTLGARAWFNLVTGSPLSQLRKPSRALAV